MEKVMNTSQINKQIIIATVLAFLMLLTRGSHVMTHISLPDASLALLVAGGLCLRKAAWFAFFVALATVIDFGAAAIDSFQAFCLTDGYWGMLPTYAVMWLAGVWLGKQSNPYNLLKYIPAGVLATFLAFIISTQTYYLFSGRFPAKGLIESLQHGWEYLPNYMAYTVMYLAVFWLIAKALPTLDLRAATTSV
jgi:hypothetical protein